MKNTYIVKHVGKPLYLQPVRAGKSTTVMPLGPTPRIFYSRVAAEQAARWWAEGEAGWDYSWEGEPIGIGSTPVIGRNLHVLRVQPVSIRGCGHPKPVRKIGKK
jgi:hypothetical protein